MALARLEVLSLKIDAGSGLLETDKPIIPGPLINDLPSLYIVYYYLFRNWILKVNFFYFLF